MSTSKWFYPAQTAIQSYLERTYADGEPTINFQDICPNVVYEEYKVWPVGEAAFNILFVIHKPLGKSPGLISIYRKKKGDFMTYDQ